MTPSKAYPVEYRGEVRRVTAASPLEAAKKHSTALKLREGATLHVGGRDERQRKYRVGKNHRSLTPKGVS